MNFGIAPARVGYCGSSGIDQSRITRIERNPERVSVQTLLQLLTKLRVRVLLEPADPLKVSDDLPADWQADEVAHGLDERLSFWLLAAIDGHGKNYSIFHQRGGNYVLTPLYDVLSAWPVIGHGRNKLPLKRAKLAMAVRGRRPRYRLDEITGVHWRELAERIGVANLWDRMQALVAETSAAFDRLEARVPSHFPEKVYTQIRAGVLSQSRRFTDTSVASKT